MKIVKLERGNLGVRNVYTDITNDGETETLQERKPLGQEECAKTKILKCCTKYRGNKQTERALSPATG